MFWYIDTLFDWSIACYLINYCFSEGYDFTEITLRVCKPCTRRCYQNEFCATTVRSLLPFRFECSTGTCFDPILVLVVFVIISPFAYQYSNFLQDMCVCWTIPYKLPSCGDEDDLSLIEKWYGPDKLMEFVIPVIPNKDQRSNRYSFTVATSCSDWVLKQGDDGNAEIFFTDVGAQ